MSLPDSTECAAFAAWCDKHGWFPHANSALKPHVDSMRDGWLARAKEERPTRADSDLALPERLAFYVAARREEAAFQLVVEADHEPGFTERDQTERNREWEGRQEETTAAYHAMVEAERRALRSAAATTTTKEGGSNG